jgi:hypothetical protein
MRWRHLQHTQSAHASGEKSECTPYAVESTRGLCERCGATRAHVELPEVMVSGWGEGLGLGEAARTRSCCAPRARGGRHTCHVVRATSSGPRHLESVCPLCLCEPCRRILVEPIVVQVQKGIHSPAQPLCAHVPASHTNSAAPSAGSVHWMQRGCVHCVDTGHVQVVEVGVYCEHAAGYSEVDSTAKEGRVGRQLWYAREQLEEAHLQRTECHAVSAQLLVTLKACVRGGHVSSSWKSAQRTTT